jgi:hypothetical protein
MRDDYCGLATKRKALTIISRRAVKLQIKKINQWDDCKRDGFSS